MGSLVALIAALLVHAAAQSGLGLPWRPPAWVPWTCLIAFALVPHALARVTLSLGRAGRHRVARRWMTFTEASGAIAFALLLLAGDWLCGVERWTGSSVDLESWPDGALALSLAPFVLYQLLAIDASVRAHGGTPSMRRHLRAFQVRMFLACLAPISAFIGLSILVAQSPSLRVQIEHVGIASAFFTLLTLAGMAWLLPSLLSFAFDTVTFPSGDTREQLDRVADRAEFEPRDVRLWRTGDLFSNAAIIGVRKRGRVVLFSDQLVAILNARELCAVYGHEIGHAARGHVGGFIAWTAAFFLLGEAAVAHVEDARGTGAAAALLVAIGIAWYVVFGWLSRRFELDADLFSLESADDLPALVSALERVGGAHRTRNGWRHFSVDRRVRFLARAAADSAFVKAFRRKLGWMKAAGVALALSGVLVQGFGLLRDLPRDRTIAALARGDYVAAGRLATDIEDDELRSVVTAAAEVSGPSAGDVARALGDALERGDVAESLALARLAALRDVDGARTVASHVAGIADTTEPYIPDALPALPVRWQARVRELAQKARASLDD